MSRMLFAGTNILEHQGGALQDPRRDLRRPHVHVLLPRKGGLAAEGGRRVSKNILVYLCKIYLYTFIKYTCIYLYSLFVLQYVPTTDPEIHCTCSDLISTY